MKRRAVVLLLGFLVITFAAGATPWLLFSDGPRFTEAQATKIKAGMTEAEVIAVLGTPSGSYTTSRAVFVMESPFDPIVHPGTEYEKAWSGDQGRIEVGFDGNDKVTQIQFLPNRDPPPTFWERVKCWFAWQ